MSEEIKNKIDDALFNFYLEADKDAVKDSLKENIRNPEEYEKNKKKLLFLAKATATKNYNDYLLQLANKFQEAITLNIEKPVALLRQIVRENPSFALYNSLEKISKEDIIEIIKDKNLIELLEQLEENEKKH